MWKGEVLLTAAGKQSKRRAAWEDGFFRVFGKVGGCGPGMDVRDFEPGWHSWKPVTSHSRMRLVVSGEGPWEWSVEFSSSKDLDKVCEGIMLELWAEAHAHRNRHLRKVPRPICAVPQWAKNEYLR